MTDLMENRRSQTRCNVCKHPNREQVERMLNTPRTSYSDIEEAYPELKYRSLKGHYENHMLPIQQLAISELVAQRANSIVDVMEALKEQIDLLDLKIIELNNAMHPMHDDYVQKMNSLRQLFNARTQTLKLYKEVKSDRKIDVETIDITDMAAILKRFEESKKKKANKD